MVQRTVFVFLWLCRNAEGNIEIIKKNEKNKPIKTREGKLPFLVLGDVFQAGCRSETVEVGAPLG